MIQYKLRSEYSYKLAYGKLDEVLSASTGPVAALTDRSGTWGHVPWSKACKRAGVLPIYGVELAFVADATDKEARSSHLTILARNNDGLRKLYALVTKATSQFFREPRAEYSDLTDLSSDCFVLSGFACEWGLLPSGSNVLVEVGPRTSPRAIDVAKKRRFRLLPVSDNNFPRPEHRQLYQMIAGRFRDERATAMHILTEEEWKISTSNVLSTQDQESTLSILPELASEFSAQLPSAELPKIKVVKDLMTMCKEAAPMRGISLRNKVYADRLKREIELIYAKGFEDYFYIVEDLVRYAKGQMLVGPARGSSCGSLVCYLLGITDIDPIPFSLLFERFIDINRMDLPDIDIDFQDTRRDLAFEYLENKYGKDCVARLGTVSRFQQASALNIVAEGLNIPPYELGDLRKVLSDQELSEVLPNSIPGTKLLEKYPGMSLAIQVEKHASHTSKHAAGVVVTKEPIQGYCSVDLQSGVAMVDKYDTEVLNLLKIDCLGLRTLSVIQDCLDQVGMTRDDLLELPIEDQASFDILNKEQYSGIFQFEGHAIQGLCRLMRVERFEDIVSLTAIARPGPLDSGGAHEFIKRRTGRADVSYLHRAIENSTRVTYGIIIYQEQVMQILREMGELSWEDTSALRKAMSKSLGEEAFNKYWPMFLKGSKKNGAKESEAKIVWDHLATMGRYSFNRSHAVAYALVSYWCMWLKSRHPLQYACACLRNAKDNESATQLLREMKLSGHNILVYDKDLSEINWSVKDGSLVGGLMNIYGVGQAKADDIMKRRRLGLPLTSGQVKLLSEGKTPFDRIFEGAERFGHIYRNPAEYNIFTHIYTISELTGEETVDCVVLAKIQEKTIRDHNEPKALARRGGREMAGKTKYLQVLIEDDTGSIRATIDRHKFDTLGQKLYESANIGDWYVFKGRVSSGFRSISVEKYRSLDLPRFKPPTESREGDHSL